MFITFGRCICVNDGTENEKREKKKTKKKKSFPLRSVFFFLTTRPSSGHPLSAGFSEQLLTYDTPFFFFYTPRIFYDLRVFPSKPTREREIIPYSF